MEYKLVIDQKVVDDYAEYYFKQHPRAKKKPIERPIVESLNQILVLRRIQINAVKQKWKEFGTWLVKRCGYDNLKLERFEMYICVYMPTRRRFDIDNHCGSVAKMLQDSFTESGFIVDDDSKHLVRLIMTGDYDKENPRTEITIVTID